MRNQRCYRRAWPFSRSPRFERLEDRLPFAVDGLTIETEYWLAPTNEHPLFLVEEWITLQDVITDVAIIDPSVESLPIEVVFSLPELFEPTELLREVPYFDIGLLAQTDILLPTSDALVDDVFAVVLDANESRILEQIIARSLPVFDLATDRLDDAVPSDELWISTSIPQASPLPIDRIAIEGLAIPVQEMGFSAIEGESIRVSNVLTGQPDAIKTTVIKEFPRLTTSDLFSANNPSMKPEKVTPENITTIELRIYKESPRNESRVNQERAWLTNGNPDLSLIGTFHTTNELEYLLQQHQSPDKILGDSGIESETDSQLTIGMENANQNKNHTIPYNNLATRIEIEHAYAKLPIHSIPEGMLPIGSEFSIKGYNPGRNFKLNEAFVAQTALICDDLSSIAIPIDNSREQSEEAAYHTYVPEKIYWVAIGSTLIITHVSLNHRKSCDSILVEWIKGKLPKFKKHTPN